MLGLKRGTVELYDHESAWEKTAADTIRKLKTVMGEAALDIQHVGSTAVRHIKAKPIIDIAVCVRSCDDVSALIPELERSGFIYRPHNVQDDMLFIVGDGAANLRTHHIHVVKQGSHDWENYLNFRDYLNADPERAKAYEALKIRLKGQHAEDRNAYTEGKAAFISEALREAKERKNPITFENYCAAFLRRDGKYLILKRAAGRKLAPGLWSGVGGHIEPDEMGDPLSACFREIWEETGITKEQIKSLQLRYIIMRRAKNAIRQNYIYFGETDAEEVADTDEGVLHWVPEGELLNREYSATYAAMLRHYTGTPDTFGQVVIGVAENTGGALHMNWSVAQDFEQEGT